MHEMNKSGTHKPLQSMSSFTEMKPIRGESEYTTSENRRLTAKEDIKRKSSSARPPDKAHISKQRSIMRTKKEMSKLKHMRTDGNESDGSDVENDELWYEKLVRCVELPKFLLT